MDHSLCRECIGYPWGNSCADLTRQEMLSLDIPASMIEDELERLQLDKRLGNSKMEMMVTPKSVPSSQRRNRRRTARQGLGVLFTKTHGVSESEELGRS
jgi:hypothetical protein